MLLKLKISYEGYNVPEPVTFYSYSILFSDDSYIKHDMAQSINKIPEKVNTLIQTWAIRNYAEFLASLQEFSEFND